MRRIPAPVCRNWWIPQKKRMDKLQKEMIRTENLKKYEKEYDTYTYICGIDEVGRESLAGIGRGRSCDSAEGL